MARKQWRSVIVREHQRTSISITNHVTNNTHTYVQYNLKHPMIVFVAESAMMRSHDYRLVRGWFLSCLLTDSMFDGVSYVVLNINLVAQMSHGAKGPIETGLVVGRGRCATRSHLQRARNTCRKQTALFWPDSLLLLLLLLWLLYHFWKVLSMPSSRNEAKFKTTPSLRWEFAMLVTTNGCDAM